MPGSCSFLDELDYNREDPPPPQRRCFEVRMPKTSKYLLLFALAGGLQAAIKLPSLISDHMVLQQGVPVRIWGAADPGESVKCRFPGTERDGEGRREREVDRVAASRWWRPVRWK